MLFGKKDKKNQSNERILNLKARVDALRQADEASRQRAPEEEPSSLDAFLEGDDVLTGREVEDYYKPAGFNPEDAPLESDQDRTDGGPAGEMRAGLQEVDLEAELQKYLRRREELGLNEDRVPPAATPVAPFQEPESPPLHLGTTWSREETQEKETTSPGNDAWPGSKTPWSSWPVAETPEVDAGGSAQESSWPGNLSWPAEDEWPSRDEAV